MQLMSLQIFSCPTALHAADKSRYCPLISHYPPCFKSIVNYIHKCSSYPAGEVDSRGWIKFARQWNSVLRRVKTVLPLLILIGPSASLLEPEVPFCTSWALHFSPTHFSFWVLIHTHTHTQGKYSYAIPLLPSCFETSA